MFKHSPRVLLCSLLSTLVACGGGGGSNSNQSDASSSNLFTAAQSSSSSNPVQSSSLAVSSLSAASSLQANSSSANHSEVSSAISSSTGAMSSSSATRSSTAATACVPLAQRWRKTSVNVGANAKPNDEYTPAIIAPLNSGESVLAWSAQTGNTIGLMKLDKQDKTLQTFTAIAGREVHSAIETATGYALAVVDNDPDIYSAKYCYSSATPNNNVCGKMDLVLLNSSGAIQARTTLTKKGNADSVGAQFIWWYGHTARLVSDGELIMAYYRSAMSTARPNAAGEVDIHAGDTLTFVDAKTGIVQSGGWDWGCSHSWSVRVAQHNQTWAAACHGDAYPNAMQLARFTAPTASTKIQWLNNQDPATRALGGLVPATNGFWMNYLQTENAALTLKLAKFDNSLSQLQQVTTITGATGLNNVYPFRPYMAAYGTNQLLLGWKAGGKLVIAVADATTGEIIEAPVITSLNIDNFQDMATTNNGDVVWAHSTGTSNIAINRIAACNLQ